MPAWKKYRRYWRKWLISSMLTSPPKISSTPPFLKYPTIIANHPHRHHIHSCSNILKCSLSKYIRFFCMSTYKRIASCSSWQVGRCGAKKRISTFFLRWVVTQSVIGEMSGTTPRCKTRLDLIVNLSIHYLSIIYLSIHYSCFNYLYIILVHYFHGQPYKCQMRLD